jgi:hypothetical protein
MNKDMLYKGVAQRCCHEKQMFVPKKIPAAFATGLLLIIFLIY